jgi:hypothetical protein
VSVAGAGEWPPVRVWGLNDNEATRSVVSFLPLNRGDFGGGTGKGVVGRERGGGAGNPKL